MSTPRILVFSPHPADEVLGCGGTLALAKANDARVRDVIITDGEKGLLDHHSAAMRRQECIAGLEILGIEDVVFWGYADQAIPLSGSLIQKYRDVVCDFMPQYILLPSPVDEHADHRRVTRGIVKALEEHWSGHLLFYESTQPVAINTTRDISSVMELKRLSLRAHASQMEQYDYENLCLSLARVRGLSTGYEFAEGFLSFDWDGSRQNFFETRPLISVIVRGNNLSYLRGALRSLMTQKYDQLEVILVWHGTGTIDLSEFDYLDVRIIEGNKRRGYNLNLGIAHARGEYVAFLDQDDVVYPDHLEVLLSQLHGNDEHDVAYSGCKVLHCEMQEGEPVVMRQEGLFNRPYHPGRLILGNYIPIHALLLRKALFRFQRFDENLFAYEDWEMLARLEMSGYRFLHVDRITCEYRLYGHGAQSIEAVHGQKGYPSQAEAVLSKLCERLSVHHLRKLSRLVTANESRIHELENELEEKNEQLARDQQRLSEYDRLERLLSDGMVAANIRSRGFSGVAEMIGRLLPEEMLFSIITPVHNVPADILEKTLISIRHQIFAGWELCLVDDASENEETLKALASLQKDDFFRGRLRYARRDMRGGIAAALNDCAAMARFPFLVFLDHDDVLGDEALLTLALVIMTENRYPLLYTDSRTIDLAGTPIHIYHKPDWSPENLLHGNYINHLTVVRRDVFNQLGGFSGEYEGSQDLDLLLRLSDIATDGDVRHIDKVLYDWRATSNSVAYSGSVKPYAFESGRRAIADHLARKGYRDVRVEKNHHGLGFLCHWETQEQGIAAIIITRDNLSGLRRCVEGLLQETDYPRLSLIIIANNACSPAMVVYLETLLKKEQVNVVIDNRTFNWAALNNRGVAESSSPLLLLLNDDVEVKERKWLMNMSKYLMLDGVGAVGATLFYPDGSLQHNGIMIDELFIALNITTWGKKDELTSTRNVSAATGACLLLHRKTLERVGGIEESLPCTYNDVDLCLNIRSKGLRIVQAADVRLVHHESATRGRLDSRENREEWERSSAFMKAKWGKQLKERYFPSYEIFAQMTKIINVREPIAQF